jgi:hypothetical protein
VARNPSKELKGREAEAASFGRLAEKIKHAVLRPYRTTLSDQTCAFVMLQSYMKLKIDDFTPSDSNLTAVQRLLISWENFAAAVLAAGRPVESQSILSFRHALNSVSYDLSRLHHLMREKWNLMSLAFADWQMAPDSPLPSWFTPLEEVTFSMFAHVSPAGNAHDSGGTTSAGAGSRKHQSSGRNEPSARASRSGHISGDKRKAQTNGNQHDQQQAKLSKVSSAAAQLPWSQSVSALAAPPKQAPPLPPSGYGHICRYAYAGFSCPRAPKCSFIH